MADETAKIIIEREYIVPLRKEWLKVPMYRRANKAVKALKQFIAKHMKIYDRDLRKIKIDVLLNNEIRFRGMRKPPAKIKVKAIKYDNDEVAVKLVEIPKHIEFQLARDARKEAESLKKQSESSKPEAKEEKKEESTDVKEKETSSKLAEEKLEKVQAKQAKHVSKTSQEVPKIQRKSLKK
jgi:large subunit ribosomal protein L31e